MIQWILIVNLIINISNDEVITPAFNQLMQFKMPMKTMEECWETSANIDGVTYILRPSITISSRCEEVVVK
jgi:hypothetical protein